MVFIKYCFIHEVLFSNIMHGEFNTLGTYFSFDLMADRARVTLSQAKQFSKDYMFICFHAMAHIIIFKQKYSVFKPVYE